MSIEVTLFEAIRAFLSGYAVFLYTSAGELVAGLQGPKLRAGKARNKRWAARLLTRDVREAAQWAGPITLYVNYAQAREVVVGKTKRKVR